MILLAVCACLPQKATYSESLLEFEKKNLDGSTRMTARGEPNFVMGRLLSTLAELDAQSTESSIQRWVAEGG